MTLDQIINAERTITRVSTALAAFGTGDHIHNGLMDAQSLLAEVRHFAVCWQDIRKMASEGDANKAEARQLRDGAIERLVVNIQPGA